MRARKGVEETKSQEPGRVGPPRTINSSHFFLYRCGEGLEKERIKRDEEMGDKGMGIWDAVT